MPIAHHGANRPPNPQPIHRVRGDDWQQDVHAILDYESYGLDPRTGRLDRSRVGGLKMMQQLFNGRVTATGRFFEGSILYAEKQLGCRAMIGLKDNTGASTNAAWFLGMKNMPDALSVGPRQLRAAALGEFDITRYVETYLELLMSRNRRRDDVTEPRPSGSDSQLGAAYLRARLGIHANNAGHLRSRAADPGRSIAVLIHDSDFLRGPPRMREGLRATYERLVGWAAKHPRLKVVTFEEILDQIVDDRTKTVGRDAVLKAARAVCASPTAPPQYIDLGGDYLSLADTFQAFAFALAGYAQSGVLPQAATTHDILGPMRYRRDEQPDRGSPSSIELSGEDVNPAVFLQLMAQTVDNIKGSNKPGTVRLNADVNVLRLQVQRNMLADALTKLQFWTFKPQRFKGKKKRTDR